MLDLEEEIRWINLIQTTNKEVVGLHYAITLYNEACGRINAEKSET